MDLWIFVYTLGVSSDQLYDQQMYNFRENEERMKIKWKEAYGKLSQGVLSPLTLACSVAVNHHTRRSHTSHSEEV